MAQRVFRVVTGEPEGSPYPKASLWLRAGARAFDTTVALGLFMLTSGAGPVVALLFLLLADGMLEGQSVGKRVFGVKVVYLPTRAPARYRESVLRNAPFALIILLGMMPQPLGDVGCLGGALVIGGLEAWKVFRDALGLRLGDLWAQTQVVDAKSVIGSQAPVSLEGITRAPGRVMNSSRLRRSPFRLRRKKLCALR